MKKFFAVIMTFVMAFILVGCKPTPELSFEETTYTMNIGDETTLQPTIVNLTGEDLVEYKVAGDEGVIKLEGDKVIATGVGSATIEASLKDYKKVPTVTLTFKVNKIAVTDVKITGAKEVRKGETITLEAAVEPETATYKDVKWETADAKIATVDATGKVTGVATGKVKISATVDGFKKEVEITVTDPLATAIAVEGKDTMVEGEEQTLTVTLTPTEAAKEYSFFSSDANIATVDKDGKVVALKGGEVTITVKTTNGKSATLTITIKGYQKDNLIVDPALEAGKEFAEGEVQYKEGFNAFKTIKEAVEAANEGALITVKAGTYADDFTIAKKVTLVGPNKNVDANTATRAEEAIITGVITLDGVTDTTINGFAFTGKGQILSTENQLQNIDIAYLNVYDKGEATSTWDENTRNYAPTAFITMTGQNSALHTNINVRNSKFDVRDDVIKLGRIYNVTIENNTFKNFERDAIRFPGGFNGGTATIENNKFVNDKLQGYNAIFVISYSNDNSKAGSEMVINVKNNVVKNVGTLDAEVTYTGFLTSKTYQEGGARFNVEGNVIENVANAFLVRANATADNHEKFPWEFSAKLNKFVGVPDGVYFNNRVTDSDNDETCPAKAVFDKNIFLDEKGKVIVPDSEKLLNTREVKNNCATLAEYELALNGIERTFNIVVDGNWATLEAGKKVTVFGVEFTLGKDAFGKIEDAITASKDGDVIYLLPGTYQGFAVDKAVTIMGNGNGQEMANVEGELTIGSNVTIESLRFTNEVVIKLVAESTVENVTFNRNVFEDVKAKGGADAMISMPEDAANIVFVGNVFDKIGVSNRLIRNEKLLEGLTLINNTFNTSKTGVCDIVRSEGTLAGEVKVINNFFGSSYQSALFAKHINSGNFLIKDNTFKNQKCVAIDFRTLDETAINPKATIEIVHNVIDHDAWAAEDAWGAIRLRLAGFEKKDIKVNVNYNVFKGWKEALFLENAGAAYNEKVVNADYNYFDGMTAEELKAKEEDLLGTTIASYNNVFATPEEVETAFGAFVQDVKLEGKTEMTTGETQELKVTLSPAVEGKTVTFKSSDTNIATVDEAGKVTAKAAGKVTISAVCDYGKAEFAIEVIAAGEEKVEIVGKNYVVMGQTSKLEAKITSITPDLTPVWSVDNEEILTIAEDGTITPKKVGTAKITCKAAEDKIAYLEVKVLEIEKDLVLVDPSFEEELFTVDKKDYVLGLNAFKTIKEAVAAANEGATIKVAAGTYADEFTIAKSVKLVGPNKGVNPNTTERAAEAIITGAITLTGNDISFDGFAITGAGVVKSNSQIKNISFRNLNIYGKDPAADWTDRSNYDITAALVITSNDNAKLISNVEIVNNKFDVKCEGIKIGRCQDVLIEGNVFKNFERDAIKQSGGYNGGTLTIVNNKFINDTLQGYNAVFFAAYSNNAGLGGQKIIFKGNTVKNVGTAGASYSAVIGARTYQENGATFVVEENTIENCLNMFLVRSNASADNHKNQPWSFTARLNKFIGVPTGVYFNCRFTSSDNDTTCPAKAVFDKNLFLDAEGKIVVPAADKFLNIKENTNAFTTVKGYEDEIRGIELAYNIVVDGNWATLEAGAKVTVFGAEYTLGTNAFGTLEAAIAAAKDNDIIYLLPGTYAGCIVDKAVTIMGNAKVEMANIEGTLTLGSNVTIDSIRFTGAILVKLTAEATVENVTFNRNVFDNIKAIGKEDAAIDMEVNAKNIVFTNNVFSVAGATNRVIRAAKNLDGFTFTNNNIIGSKDYVCDVIRINDTLSGNVTLNNNYIGESYQAGIYAAHINSGKFEFKDNKFEGQRRAAIDLRTLAEGATEPKATFEIVHNVMDHGTWPAADAWGTIRLRLAGFAKADINVKVNYNAFIGWKDSLFYENAGPAYAEKVTNLDRNYFDGMTAEEIAAKEEDLLSPLAISYKNVFANVEDLEKDYLDPQPDVEPLKVEGPSRVKVEETIKLTANRKATFTSSDPTIATVDAEGNVKGIKIGKVTITAVEGGETVTVEVEVRDNKAYDLTKVIVDATLEADKQFKENEVDYRESYNAFKTIAEAVAAAAENSVVTVKAGTYKEDFEITKPLTLVGANKDIDPNKGTRVAETIIEGNVSIKASDVTLNGLTLQGAGKRVKMFGKLANVKMINLIDTQSGEQANGGRTGIISLEADSAVEKFTFSNNKATCEGATGRNLIAFYGKVTDLTMENNVITNGGKTLAISECARIQNIAGIYNIKNNDIVWGGDNFTLHLGENGHFCKEINIIENRFAGGEKYASGLYFKYADPDTDLNIIGNKFENIGGTTFRFRSYTAGARVTIKYNYFDANTSFKVTDRGGATVTTNFNCYMVDGVDGGTAGHTIDKTTETTYATLELLEAAYAASKTTPAA